MEMDIVTGLPVVALKTMLMESAASFMAGREWPANTAAEKARLLVCVDEMSWKAAETMKKTDGP